MVNLHEAAARALQPFLAAAYRVREFVRSHTLNDRPHTYLWLAKTYAVLLVCMLAKFGVRLS